jgi:hypothetical protein
MFGLVQTVSTSTSECFSLHRTNATSMQMAMFDEGGWKEEWMYGIRRLVSYMQ